MSLQKFIKQIPICYFSFVSNDAEQLKQLLEYCVSMVLPGSRIELPSAILDLDRILETGISKIIWNE